MFPGCAGETFSGSEAQSPLGVASRKAQDMARKHKVSPFLKRFGYWNDDFLAAF